MKSLGTLTIAPCSINIDQLKFLLNSSNESWFFYWFYIKLTDSSVKLTDETVKFTGSTVKLTVWTVKFTG